MELRNVQQVDFKNARVLVRVDFNVELNNVSEVQEHFRLDIVKETINYISAFPGVKVALLTHFGRPDGKRNEKFSVGQITMAVERALQKPVTFVPDCTGERVEAALSSLSQNTLLLLENTRFYDGEEANDPEFARALAKPFSIFVNEAFSVCHRAHASVVGVPKLLPAYAGFRVLREIEKLDQVRLMPRRPAIAVIGGAKIETKLPLIRELEKNYDAVLVGGKVANEMIDEKITCSEKVLVPQDFDSPKRLDIGPNTIAYYIQIIKTAKTIIWNGPMGKFEEKPYDVGTGAVLQAMLESEAFVLIGGGESLAVLEKANVMDKIGFVSSGGGAMLEYLSGHKLPGLAALEIGGVL